tara:strand:+ start:238 stop:1413 length:1176 start_codon:yes stop_codon:yes gene_type:complete
MYTTTFIFTSLAIASSFLFLIKKFARFNLYIYSLFFYICAITRPYDIDAIDNGNLANYLTSQYDWGLKERITYSFVYNLTLPFENYEIKFLFLILISLILLSIGIYRLIRFFKTSREHNNKWNLYTFLVCLLLPSIGSTLYMIHLRQFVSFSLVILFISFLIKPVKNNIFILALCTLFVALIHPIYLLLFLSFIPFLINYVISIKQIKIIFFKLYNLFYKLRFFLIIPILLGLFYFGFEIYLNVFSKIPILAAYAFIGDTEIGRVGALYLIPILLLMISQFSATTIYSNFIIKNKILPIKKFTLRSINIYSIFILSFLLILISIEFFTPTIYAVGRVKSALYPSLFVTSVLLGYEKRKYYLFFNYILIVLFALASFYSTYKRLMLVPELLF